MEQEHSKLTAGSSNLDCARQENQRKCFMGQGDEWPIAGV